MNHNHSITFLTKLHNQGLSYSQIGTRFGISRQRAHQLIKQPPYYLDKKNYIPKTKICWNCGDTIFGLRRKVYFYGKNNGILVDEGCFLSLLEKGIIDMSRTKMAE